ncbi:hypothetical protein [Sedimenticola selenatireducens]|uniref:DUF302 domain-containing protein n=1 Tax=Sedimenticola selenatireducens TaxID=191960 RepID=A0A558DM61_9GAMM|nr:hypothetical protein [Sedimenticola selenatireducens]TVO78745.1 hypothetical protein FHP88_00880 [Sedimenticola selenatireducens]TVT62107.1 MAG: hypothetical protein FHK78_15995 [Sedimenticola selenatireducens]
MRSVQWAVLLLSLLFSSFSLVAQEGERLRPFILAETSQVSLTDKLSSVTAALEKAGFSIEGEYAPYAGAHILVITSEGLRKQAAATQWGGYGAALRVSLTQRDGMVQVSYTNPQWMGNVYRMSGDFAAAGNQLQVALGNDKAFGSEGGRTVENLREYHYMMFMPYFDEQVELASYDSHQAALEAVEAGLAAGKGGVSKISRIEISGKDEVLFNVAVKQGAGSDEPVMQIIDQADLRHTAHLPYDMLVSGNKVYMLHGKFRIAQSFPDLTMSTFMKISDAPDAIEQALKMAASK